MGAVAVLGGIWEIVFREIVVRSFWEIVFFQFFRTDGVRLVGPRGSSREDAGLHCGVNQA
jgi:hypothetical protein